MQLNPSYLIRANAACVLFKIESGGMLGHVYVM